MRNFELDGDVLRATWRNRTEKISLQSIASAPSLEKGFFGATLIITTDTDDNIILKCAGYQEASEFAEIFNKAWSAYNLANLEREKARVDMVLAGVLSVSAPSRYPAACEVAPILEEALAVDASLLSKLNTKAIGPEAAGRIEPIRKFVADPGLVRKAGIDVFVNAELDRWKDFFDTTETMPLTPEQRLSVVVDEDATLILAGAGSGKTSVITTKAAYLIKVGIRRPEEILLLAFAKNAAEEMSERVRAKSGNPIVARTFHAIAYDIIGTVEGSKPALADHASDDMALNNLIKSILSELIQQFSDVSRLIIQFFAQFFIVPKTEWDFPTKHAFYAHIESQDLRTLQGERVKSYEELQIANWLYENGIEYEYEPVYEHRIPETGRREYQPDFRLIDSGIYIEHFGVLQQKMPDGSKRLITAPFVDRDEYLAGMEWKRKVHAERNTILIETFSFERLEGRLLIGLEEKLAPYVSLNPRQVDTIYDRIIKLKHVDEFSKLLGTFLRKFKSGGYSLQDCEAKSVQMNLGKRARAFLSVFTAVYNEYQKRLGGRIDFEDMILRAAHHCETGRYKSPFRHILIDEFQDISQSRARLVKALKAQHIDTRVFAVGDDWQSIFRFAGSDIQIMRYFGREFGGTFNNEAGVHKTVDLGRTFRSVDQIAFVARTFVLRNPAQIEKKISTARTTTEPAIKIVTVSKDEDEVRLSEVLTDLSHAVEPEEKPATVLLLGRYRFIEPDLRVLRRRFPELKITFKTIHASKGLEADHVILLNADSGRTGFPSAIVDDPLLSLVSPEIEGFENAEERRVMYVAMTRARHTLTILASDTKMSSFVTELMQDSEYGISGVSEAESAFHVCGECGGRLVNVTAKDRRRWYRCEHVRYCGNTLPACASCGTGLPRRADASRDFGCVCGASHPGCPNCEDGWLVERSSQYGRFLGCVRYPSCTGKAQTSPVRRHYSGSKPKRSHPS